MLAMMSLLIGQMKGIIDQQTLSTIASDIRRIPTLIQDILNQSEKIEDLAKIFT